MHAPRHPIRADRLAGSTTRTTFALLLASLVLAAAPPAHAAPFEFAWRNPTPQGNSLWGSVFEDDATGYAVGEKGAVLRTTDGGATWADITRFAEFSTNLYDVMLLGPGDLLAAGEPPGIFRSQDGGESWTPVANPSTQALRNLNRFDAATLTACGDAGQVIRSTDDGATWTAMSPAGAQSMLDQWWWTPLDGYVVGELRARRTTDGGATWSPLPGVQEAGSATFTDVQFQGAQDGWLLEHFTTYRTTDGGASWFKRHGSLASSPIYQAEAIISNGTDRLVVTDLEGAEIWRTTNDGLNWTKLYERDKTRGYTDVDRLPGGALVAVSSDGDLLRSSDAGTSWTNFTANPGSGDRFDMTRMAFLSNGKAFAGGYSSQWLASTDAGTHWAFTPGPSGLTTPTAIEFLDDQFGFAGGYTSGQSKISRTTDGGASWTSHSIAPSYIGYVQGIAIPDASTQFAAIYGGTNINHLYRSTDSGITWHPRENGLIGVSRFEDVQFLDANVGFVAGEGPSFTGRVWKTTDGGGSWTVLAGAGMTGYTILDMLWRSQQDALVASPGGIFRTTDGGASWQVVLAASTRDLDFRDATHGVAAAFYDDIVWTTDDAGLSWNPVVLSWNSSPSAIAARPFGFTVCGPSSVILDGRDLAATGVGTPAAAGPVSAVRAPVTIVPNPATGAVSLRFAAPGAGIYSVGVFDASGRRVAAFDSALPAGPAAVAWEPRSAAGARLAAGRYLVSVRSAAGAVVGTGRLLLLSR